MRKCETAPPGVYDDGAGLRLYGQKNGTRSWIFRYQLNHRRRDMGIGGYPEVSLARARERVAELRSLKAAGVDPLSARALDRARRRTFRKVAEEHITTKAAGWRNAKQGQQWVTTLQTYAFPILGGMDVAHVETAHVLVVLRPIWPTKPETVSRVRQRIQAVLDAATVAGSRTGPNPARWKGHLDALLPARAKVAAVEHHAAPDWREAPAFFAELQARDGTAARALAFAILTASRSGEVRGASWAEIDRDAVVWTIPAQGMKAAREHRVPLTPAAVALLDEPAEPGALLFPGMKAQPLSDMSLTAVLRRMGRGDLTAHGFRSTFRDWAGETTAHPREVIEAALAPRLRDKAEAAYARGDLFTKRRKLMADWAGFVTSGRTNELPDG